ncbi:CvpA family protein [Nafulsella turpanensis]|uniref:CvpA family protein n=1 Tax=Nafulsella turpanensis TaxID=1265690 RepID=UPI000347758C|nr:CvpA family protein [Nafulsella turpanensis]
MSAVDIVLLLLLLLGAYKGYTKGLLLEVIGIIALVVALIAGFQLLQWAMDLLGTQLDINESLLPYIAFLLLFAAIVVGINLLGKALKKILDMTFFGTFDNLIGAMVGLLKWALALSVLIWLINTLEVKLPAEAVADSFVYPVLEPFAPQVFGMMGDVLPAIQNLLQPKVYVQP